MLLSNVYLLLLVRLILKIYFSFLLKHYFSTLSKVIFLTLFFCNNGFIILSPHLIDLLTSGSPLFYSVISMFFFSIAHYSFDLTNKKHNCKITSQNTFYLKTITSFF